MRMDYRDKDGHALYKGVCRQCGLERIAKIHDLKVTKVCSHNNFLVKWKNKRIRNIFREMKYRCYNEKDKSYKWYGKKGIKITEEWLNNPCLFEEWALENGYKDWLTIDRIDENKDYCPENCRWVTNRENAKYKSTTNLIKANGERHTGNEWSNILNLSVNVINTYVRKYGKENTEKFIEKYLENPGMKPKVTQSYYDLYMNL